MAIAQGMLAQGYETTIAAPSLDSAKEAAEKLGEKVIPLELDVSYDLSIEQAIAILSERLDRLDVSINHAGIYPNRQVDSLNISRELLNAAM